MKGLENKAKKLKDLRMKPLIIKPLMKGKPVNSRT